MAFKIIYKCIIITSTGPIHELGGQHAPILYPFVLDINTIYRLLVDGHEVYEVREDGCRTKLNYDNYDKGDLIVVTPEIPGGGECGSYVHPTGDGYKHLPVMGENNGGKALFSTNSAGAAIWRKITISDVEDFPNLKDYSKIDHSHELATIEKDGFMSKDDKRTLVDFETNIDTYVIEHINDIVNYLNKAESKLSFDSIKDTESNKSLKEIIDAQDTHMNTKYIKLCISRTADNGIQPLNITIPFECEVKSISCYANKYETDLQFNIKKISGENEDVINGNPILIKAGNVKSDIVTVVNEHIYKDTCMKVDIITTLDKPLTGLDITLEVIEK